MRSDAWPPESTRYGGDSGADYAERSLPGTGYTRGEYPPRGGAGGGGYPGPDPDYGYHDSYPPRGGPARDDYAPEYPDEPGHSAGPGYPGYHEGHHDEGYHDEGYRNEGYHDEGDYPGADYPEPGYAPAGYARDDYPRQPGYPGERGMLHEVLARSGDWRGHDVYASGPTPMVEATVTQLMALGVPRSRIYLEDFGWSEP